MEATAEQTLLEEAAEMLAEALSWYEAYEEVPAPRSQTRKTLAKLGWTLPDTEAEWKKYWKVVHKKRRMIKQWPGPGLTAIVD